MSLTIVSCTLHASFQFINTAGLDFNSVNDRKPVEEIDLVAQKEGVEYAVR